MGEKNGLVRSSMQRDAEITTATANFHPKPRLKGDPFGTPCVSTTRGLGLVGSFLAFIYFDCVTDAFCITYVSI